MTKKRKKRRNLHQDYTMMVLKILDQIQIKFKGPHVSTANMSKLRRTDGKQRNKTNHSLLLTSGLVYIAKQYVRN